MGNNVFSSSKHYSFATYENVQSRTPKSILINTLPDKEQSCLIMGTILASNEETTMNQMFKDKSYDNIYIYGRHHLDESIYKKYEQLISLGLPNIHLYMGGLFEWLLLQDIYGDDMFPTSCKELDILKFRPRILTPG